MKHIPPATIAVVAPAPPPHTPGKAPGHEDQSRLADLTPDDIETLAADPAAVEIIKRLMPECSAELDAMLMAEESGPEEGSEMAPEPETARVSPNPRLPMARPQTRLARV
ncbi:MAG: hypothetical protein IT537_03160 [Hyphomicrobiales bacterium]|nr:hypothetical protein [Hyphomicrobiales bacterium]